MEIIFRIFLFISGVVNILPSLLAFFPNKITKSYGIEIPNINYELLLRHRAILFGIIGGIMVFSSFTKMYYEVATTLGLISMGSFIILYFLLGNKINSELKKVMITDVIATTILLFVALVYFITL